MNNAMDLVNFLKNLSYMVRKKKAQQVTFGMPARRQNWGNFRADHGNVKENVPTGGHGLGHFSPEINLSNTPNRPSRF